MTTPDDPATTAQRHERYAETPHGRVYATEIPGGDPPIVLMHGFPDDHRIYDKLLPRLSPRRAVTFDFVGHGHRVLASRAPTHGALGGSWNQRGTRQRRVCSGSLSQHVRTGFPANGWTLCKTVG
jgi:pimeloyl-ACP methyl ester carboxylesterase